MSSAPTPTTPTPPPTTTTTTKQPLTAALPVDGPGLLPAVRENLDGHLTGALVAAGFDVQPAEKTRRFVKDAVDAGLACSLAEDDCAAKAGIAAGADRVVVARAVTVDERLVVELRLVDVEGGPARGAAGLVESDAPEGSLARIARRLVNPAEAGATTALPLSLSVEPRGVVVSVDGGAATPVSPGGGADGVVWVAPGAHALVLSKDGYEPRTVTVDVSADRLPAPVNVALERSFPVLVGVGVGLGVGGGLVALASTVGVIVAESALATPLAPAERDSMSTLGRVFLGGAVVGVAAAATGTAVALVGGSE